MGGPNFGMTEVRSLAVTREAIEGTTEDRAGVPQGGPGVLPPEKFCNFKCPYVHFGVQMWHTLSEENTHK